MTEEYVELHVRSAFSFLEGASLPEALISQAAEFEIPAMALLDRDSLSGAVRCHNAAGKAKLRALVGAEVTAKEGFRLQNRFQNAAVIQHLPRAINQWGGVRESQRMRTAKAELAASTALSRHLMLAPEN